MDQGYTVLDVRRNTEAQTEHVAGALNMPLKDLQERINELDQNANYLLHCAGGYRSMIASSILKQHGFNNFKNVHGGFDKIKEQAAVELLAGKCPNQLRQEKLSAIN